MDEAAVAALTRQVLWGGFAIGLAFGALAQRSHFCTMGALADWFSMGDTGRLRQWVVAIGVAMIGFNTMVLLGWLDPVKSLYGGPRVAWLSGLVGGALFGFGMVLASGCGAKSLVRLGGGNLKSLVVLVMLAVSAFATQRGLTAVLRVETVDTVAFQMAEGQTLAPAFGLGIGALLIVLALLRPATLGLRGAVAGAGIGALVVAAWWLSGRFGYVSEHPATLEEAFVATGSRRMESLSFVAPTSALLDWLLYFSDASKALTLGAASSVGVVLGSWLAAVAGHAFRWEGFRDATDTANHLAGGVMMGVGGITALGCTIGQGVSGLSTLSLGSVFALAGIVGGAWLALRWQLSRI